jgi:putative transcriptional regulator
LRKQQERKTQSGILSTVHKTAAGLHRVGVIDKATMREFDALCLTPVTPMAPEEIKALQEREQISQPVFASYLNVRKDASASRSAARSGRTGRR